MTAEQFEQAMKLAPQIVAIFTKNEREPMDSDEVNDCMEKVAIVIDYHQGNLTCEEVAEKFKK